MIALHAMHLQKQRMFQNNSINFFEVKIIPNWGAPHYLQTSNTYYFHLNTVRRHMHYPSHTYVLTTSSGM